MHSARVKSFLASFESVIVGDPALTPTCHPATPSCQCQGFVARDNISKVYLQEPILNDKQN